MTALGPAGIAIFAFIGAIGALTTIYALEQAARRRFGLGR